MSSAKQTKNSTAASSNLLVDALNEAQAIVVGAGSGLSTAAGLTYSGERFETLFPDFIAAYGLSDMYSAGFFPFPSPEEKWAYWSRHVMANRYDQPSRKVYETLYRLLDGRHYFVVTTNVDHAFLLHNFNPHRFFAMQGDYGLWQCSVPCRQETWSNEDAVRDMVASQRDRSIPSNLIPVCPYCGAEAMMHLRIDHRFVHTEEWHAAARRYEDFLTSHAHDQVLFLEIGVGWNTPSLIKYPFWRATLENPRATYMSLNHEVPIPAEIAERSIAMSGDIAATLCDAI